MNLVRLAHLADLVLDAIRDYIGEPNPRTPNNVSTNSSKCWNDSQTSPNSANSATASPNTYTHSLSGHT
jgi:hypothetical protein